MKNQFVFCIALAVFSCGQTAQQNNEEKKAEVWKVDSLKIPAEATSSIFRELLEEDEVKTGDKLILNDEKKLIHLSSTNDTLSTGDYEINNSLFRLGNEKTFLHFEIEKKDDKNLILKKEITLIPLSGVETSDYLIVYMTKE